MSTAVSVVDYGLGNVGSVVNMLKHIGVSATLASGPDDIASARILVLPGVGHFDAGMKNLEERSLLAPLSDAVLERKVPVLGICLGMQLLSRRSEEGRLPGLGWIDAETRRLSPPPDSPLPLPHMGWGETKVVAPQLFDESPEPPRFYYVHSYHVVCHDRGDVAATCTYGVEFTAALRHDHIFGTQFHPEKSHRHGMRLLRSFVRIAGRLVEEGNAE
jgi:imidazole glycerol-phosphate synthase subunit HisH